MNSLGIHEYGEFLHHGIFWDILGCSIPDFHMENLSEKSLCYFLEKCPFLKSAKKIESAIPFRRKSAINSKGAFCNIFGSHTPLRPSLFQWSNIRCMCQEKTVVRRPCGTLLFIVFSKRWIYFVFYFEQSQSSPWEQPVKSVYWEGDSDRPGLKRWITLMGTKVFTYTWTPL